MVQSSVTPAGGVAATSCRNDPSRILNTDELARNLQALRERFPELVTLSDVGRSYEGRPLWLVEITDSATGPASGKPGLWLDGNTHAGELAGSAACLHALWSLAERFSDGEPKAQRMLRERALVVMPRVNPDGAEQVLATGISLRSGTRPWPEVDRELPGFQAGDVDGDGRVLQMRVASRAGAWKVSSLDARLLVAREVSDDPDAGPYYDLYREGQFFGAFDPDRLEVPPAKQGLDFNRNYPYGYRPEYKQKGAGPIPLSEPETRAQVEAVLARPRLAAALTYHTFGGALLRPFSDKPDTAMEPSDLALFLAMSAKGAELTGYHPMSVFHEFRYSDLDTISGAFDDWAYNDHGLLAWTIEIWNVAAQAGIEITDFVGFFFKGKRTAEQTSMILNWCEINAPGGFANWYPFEHPQLGQVELGGWNRLISWQNPQGTWLQRECEKNLAFVELLLMALPCLQWRELSCRAEGAGLFRLRAVGENVGYLPTSGTRHGRHFAPPVRAVLTSDSEFCVVGGAPEQELGFLEGVSDVVLAPFADPVSFSGSTRGRVCVVEWIVRAAEGAEFTVSIDGGRAGAISRKVIASTVPAPLVHSPVG